jgi:hypothetical protein
VKRTLIVVALLAAGVFSGSSSVAAHHGAATFDIATEMTLTGTVTDWLWFNPHCFLKFDVKDDSGKTTNWAVESGNPTDMTKRGWTRLSFKKGDEVSVVLQPAKNGTPVGRIRSVTVNGKTYQ